MAVAVVSAAANVWVAVGISTPMGRTEEAAERSVGMAFSGKDAGSTPGRGSISWFGGLECAQ